MGFLFVIFYHDSRWISNGFCTSCDIDRNSVNSKFVELPVVELYPARRINILVAMIQKTPTHLIICLYKLRTPGLCNSSQTAKLSWI
jgi:hypothetical protein